MTKDREALAALRKRIDEQPLLAAFTRALASVDPDSARRLEETRERDPDERMPALLDALDAEYAALRTPDTVDRGAVLEFRPRENGEFDEIVARFRNGMVHVETMSGTSCYVGFYWDDGQICQWYINSSRKLTYHHEVSKDAALSTPPSPVLESCEGCNGNGYSGGILPEQEELRGENDFRCEMCGGDGKAPSPAPDSGEREGLAGKLERALAGAQPYRQYRDFAEIAWENRKTILAALKSTPPVNNGVLVEADGWQPIETAEKDLARCLLFCPETAGRHEGHDGIVFGSILAGKPRANGMSGDWLFTHWRRLPAPPAALKHHEGRP